MAVIVHPDTKVIVQGITGNQGSFHAQQMKAFGTRVVGGVSPGKGGGEVGGIPVFDTCHEAVEKTGATASAVFVPGPYAFDAAMEAMDAGIRVLAMVPEKVPVHDTMQLVVHAQRRGVTIIGPNTFGICTPAGCKIGIPPNQIFSDGPVGVVARSGTLAYQIVYTLSKNGLGQSTVIGMGGDRVIGTGFVQALQLFEADPATRAVVMVGEIGGIAEEVAAEYIKTMSKPVVCYLAGRAAPKGKRMGHAGAIIEGNRGTFESKVAALTGAGAEVAQFPWEVADLMRKRLR